EEFLRCGAALGRVKHLQSQIRAFNLGLRLGGIVLGRFVVALCGRLMLEQILLPPYFVLGRDEVRPRLDRIGPGGAQIGTLDDGERVALGHTPAEGSQHSGDPAADRRENVRHTLFVKCNATRCDQMQVESPRPDGLDRHSRALNLGVSEPGLAGRRRKRDGITSGARGQNEELGEKGEDLQSASHGVTGAPTALSSSARLVMYAASSWRYASCIARYVRSASRRSRSD